MAGFTDQIQHFDRQMGGKLEYQSICQKIVNYLDV